MLFSVLEMGFRGKRWNGESIENSSWRASSAGIVRGEKRSDVYSESSILKVLSRVSLIRIDRSLKRTYHVILDSVNLGIQITHSL